MPTKNDPTLAILLNGVSDPEQREAIIKAHSSLLAGGADSLPGCLGILLSRLVVMVVKVSEVVSPTAKQQQQVISLGEELTHLRKDDIPTIIKAKDAMVAANLNTRRLRMTYVFLWLALVAVFSALAGGYATYRFTAIIPNQIKWVSILKSMSQHHIGILPADPENGSFGIIVGGRQPVNKAIFVKENGQNAAVEIRWQDEESQ